jgi:hypothetical protein
MDNDGIGGKPSNRYIIRIPLYDIYVTAKSLRRIKLLKNTKAYKLGMKRIGNIDGYVCESMLYGQQPGKMIYIIGQKHEDEDEYDIKYINT